MRLDGFGLLVEDMAKMIRFYRDVLGFEIKEEELEPWGCCVPVARVQHRPSREARPENLLYCRSGRKSD